MNTRLRRLERTIGKCLMVEDIFAAQGVCGEEPIYYDDIIAGFSVPPRNGFFLDWDLVFRPPAHSTSREEEKDHEPTCIEVVLSGGERGDRLILVSYFPEYGIWVIKGSTDIGLDGNEALSVLANVCQLSAGETRRISEDEAMRIIVTLVLFYKRQPAS
jgi:hypothetical protein